jgi:hypothetical protein
MNSQHRERAIAMLQQVKTFPAGSGIKHIKSGRVYTVDHVHIQDYNLLIHTADKQVFSSKEVYCIKGY